jgi:hypothetical protein
MSYNKLHARQNGCTVPSRSKSTAEQLTAGISGCSEAVFTVKAEETGLFAVGAMFLDINGSESISGFSMCPTLHTTLTPVLEI